MLIIIIFVCVPPTDGSSDGFSLKSCFCPVSSRCYDIIIYNATVKIKRDYRSVIFKNLRCHEKGSVKSVFQVWIAVRCDLIVLCDTIDLARKSSSL